MSLQLPVCENCFRSAKEAEPVEPASLHVAFDEFRKNIARTVEAGVSPPAGHSCRDCGAPIGWYTTVNGKWIPMEPAHYPVSEIPPTHRWEIVHGDTASHMRGIPEDGQCRICHFDVCPHRAEPPESPRLRQVWKHHGQGRGSDSDRAR